MQLKKEYFKILIFNIQCAETIELILMMKQFPKRDYFMEQNPVFNTIFLFQQILKLLNILILVWEEIIVKFGQIKQFENLITICYLNLSRLKIQSTALIGFQNITIAPR